MLHRLSVGFDAGQDLGPVVYEGGVDHAVGRRRAAAQALEILQRAAMNRGACRGQSGRSCVRAGKTEHLMTRNEQFLDNGRADPSGGASDKDTHEQNLPISGRCTIFASHLSW